LSEKIAGASELEWPNADCGTREQLHVTDVPIADDFVECRIQSICHAAIKFTGAIGASSIANLLGMQWVLTLERGNYAERQSSLALPNYLDCWCPAGVGAAHE
jgi:hypothetical protein